jgi:WD40 repeat protein
MKTNPSLKSFKLSTLSWLATAIVFFAMPETARCETIFITRPASSRIGKYDSTTGAAINPSLVSGLYSQGIVVSGGKLFVTDIGGTIGVYNATTGAPINPSLVSGLGLPFTLALSGGNLFVVSFIEFDSPGTIGEYNATTGAPINPALVSGVSSNGWPPYPVGIAVSGGNLFVTNYGAGTIGEYDATTGAPINPSLVSGLSNPLAMALSGGNLFVTNYGAGTIGVYDATTGAAINPSLVSGLSSPDGIALSGGDLFVTDSLLGTIGVYDATTGAAINRSLVSGLNFEDDGQRSFEPVAIAVTTPSSVPDVGPDMFLVAVLFASLISIYRWTDRPV